MPTLEDLRNRVLSLLASGPARRIDFQLGAIRVNAAGLDRVSDMIRLKALGSAVGIDVVVGRVPRGAGAAYNNPSNELRFRSTAYGASATERAAILHECVHGLRDVQGTYLPTPAGPEWTFYLEDEAAAYVAGALYHLYETGSASSSTHPVFVKAYAIARSIMGTPGAAVPDADADELAELVGDDPTYIKAGVTSWTPSEADGVIPGFPY
jgi:hypothetical protein